MATRSTIAIQLKNNKGIKAIYCHWDGHPESNGKLLVNHYNNESLVEMLIGHGDCSSLAENVFDSVFYMRDKNEKNCNEFMFRTVKTWKQHFCDSEYYYLFKDGKWYCENYEGIIIDIDQYCDMVEKDES